MNDPILEDLQDKNSVGMVGTTIANRYKIVSKLGAGGFAVVYRAFDSQIERDVAIKILNLDVLSGGEQSREAMLERFRREARLAARIRHPNVVEIYDLGELDNKTYPYIIMEILEGYDLDDELRKHKGLAPTRAIPLFCGALDALAEAHRKGIIHKDIKPANLFINHPNTRQESLKVVDFGIAHIGGTLDSRLTQTGMMFGTPQYLPPEYIERQIVTPAMDVYQMALVLVEMLTGAAVVDAETPWQCAMKHVMRSYALPEPLLTSPLGPVLMRALEADHEERYPDAAAFVEAMIHIDPTTIPDVRNANVTFRSFDTTSGQWLPTPTDTGATPVVNIQTLAGQDPTTAFTQPPPKNRSVLLIGIFVTLLVLISTALFVLFTMVPDKDANASQATTPPTPEITQPVSTKQDDTPSEQVQIPAESPAEPAKPADTIPEKPAPQEPEPIKAEPIQVEAKKPVPKKPAEVVKKQAPKKASKPNPTKPAAPKKPAEPEKPKRVPMQLAP